MTEGREEHRDPPWPVTPVDPAAEGVPSLPSDFTRRVADKVRMRASLLDLYVLILVGFSAVVLGLLRIRKGRA